MHATRFSSHSTGARRYPLSYVFSGYYRWGNGNLDNQDSYGLWWSTTANSGSNAYYLGMDSRDLNPQLSHNKANGFALRCVSYSTSTRRYPLSYVMAGNYSWSAGGLYNQADSLGAWWSTIAYGDNAAYVLLLVVSGLDPQYNYGRLGGFSLRCV